MSSRSLTSALVVAIVLIFLASGQTWPSAPAAPTAPAAKTTPTAETWTPPKTPWGDPDLQGTYTSDDYMDTPLERPTPFAERLYLPDDALTPPHASYTHTAP